MLRIDYRINEVKEVSNIINLCIQRNKYDTSFLKYYADTLKISEEEVRNKFPDAYYFYVNVFDDAVELLDKYSELRTYFSLTGTQEECKFVTESIDHLNKRDITTLTKDEFLFGCNYNLFDLIGGFDEIEDSENRNTEEEMTKVITHLKTMGFDFNTIFAQLNKTLLTDNEKITLLSLYQNVDSLLPKIIELYTKILEKFKSYLPSIETYILTIEDKLHEEDGSIISVDKLIISKYVDLNSSTFKDTVFSLSISVIMPNAMSLTHSNDRSIPSQLICGLFCFGLEDILNEEIRKENRLLEQMKVLGDPTRLKIIKLLSKRDYYTKELADDTELTPATVSHHMRQLLGAKLVIIYGEGRKTYYRLCKSEMEQISIFFKQLGGE